MKPTYDLILFDLDGTLTDSEPGITGCVKLALEEMNFPIPPRDTLIKFIGPPLWSSFMDYCGMTEEQAEQAVVLYRKTYNVTGAFQNPPYPGVMDMLDAMRDAGALMAVATSKPGSITIPVLDYFKLSQYFSYVSAPSDREHSSNKKELIVNAMGHFHISPQKTVMIGDTKFDASGAKQAGTDFIGVLYGFGTRRELEQEGAARFAADREELTSMLLTD